ncbi:hypothetical protein [Jannaschia sp. LMIT008]|uniref:hypothetical protein n=1 Tax=Jannaschia maritima TaxID=3032585 RepID=UPI002811D6BC|nr:hypothetical protein [Jannaschia sp. LMIT008]
MRAVLRVLLRLSPLGATLAATLWALSTNPLAAPWVERSGTDLALALERAVRLRASPRWVAGELDRAVAAGDADRAAMLLSLADDLHLQGVPRAAAEALVASRDDWLVQAKACGACMADIATCPSTTALAVCAVPFEMSPLGDANALRRAGMAWIADEPVDGLDAGFAAVGLGATGALVATGGGSATVKAGAALLRTARRMGTLTPGLVRTVGDAARARDVATLGALAGDMGRVRDAVGLTGALALMRHVDGPADAARLARVADAAGAATPRAMAVLGRARVFRATVRLSRMAAGTLALAWLCVLQAGAIAAARLGGAALRWAARPARA